jgi:hypothetical protein
VFWAAVIAAQAAVLAVAGVVMLGPLLQADPTPAAVAAAPRPTSTPTVTPGANVVPTNASLATAPGTVTQVPSVAPATGTSAQDTASATSSVVVTSATAAIASASPTARSSAAAAMPSATPAVSATTAPAVPASASPTASPTVSPTASATATQAQGWTFAGVRLVPDPDYRQLHLYGYLVNGTGSAQEVTSIDGTFYDAQGEVIAAENQVADLWAFDVVPPGIAVPFELTAIGITDAARYDLTAAGDATTEVPHNDFEFLGVSQTQESQITCVSGAVRNRGRALQNHLSVVAVLLDAEGRVVNFDATLFADVTDLVGDQTLDFDICIWPPNEGTTHYELQAWGY